MKKLNNGKVLTQEQAEQRILEIMSETHQVPVSEIIQKVNKPRL